MVWTLLLLLALHPGYLAQVGTDAGRTQAEYRTSGPCTNPSGPLWRDQLARRICLTPRAVVALVLGDW